MVETRSSSIINYIYISKEVDNTNLAAYHQVVQYPILQCQPGFALSPDQLNYNQPIYYLTMNRLKFYHRSSNTLTDPLYYVNPNNMNLVYHALKDREESQGWNLQFG